jgi:hypothetical protein
VTSYLDLGCFEVENVGSQFLSLRQRPRLEHPLPVMARRRIRRNGGLLRANLWTGNVGSQSQAFSVRPLFSKALDCAESVRSWRALVYGPS